MQRHIDIKTERQRDRETEIQRHKETERNLEKDKQTVRLRYRDRNVKTRGKEMQREIDRETKKQGESDIRKINIVMQKTAR